MIRLLLVDDHFVVRSGLAASLGLESDMEVVAEAADASEALSLFGEFKPDVVIMDLQLGRDITAGIDAISAICKLDPSARVLVFTSFARDENIYRAIRSGALGYLEKTSPRSDLLAAVHTVAQGKRWLPEPIAKRFAERLNRPEPSPREYEVLVLISKGNSNKEIAHILKLSEETVKRHVSHLIEKLGVNDRTQAVTEALRRGLIQVP